VRARAGSVEIACNRERKDTWRVHVDGAQLAPTSPALLIQCEWRVYAWDLSVRGAHLDDTHGFFNGTSLFLCPNGFEQEAIELTISRPGENLQDWLIACGLPSQPGTLKDPHGCPVLRAGGLVKFQATDFDSLIDHPVEMGGLHVESFTALGVEHVFAVYGADTDLDLQRICNDLKPVCEAQIALFEPERKKRPLNDMCLCCMRPTMAMADWNTGAAPLCFLMPVNCHNAAWKSTKRLRGLSGALQP